MKGLVQGIQKRGRRIPNWLGLTVVGTGRQLQAADRQTNRQTDRQTDGRTDRLTHHSGGSV